MRRIVALSAMCAAACGRVEFDLVPDGAMAMVGEDGAGDGGDTNAWPAGPGCFDEPFAIDFAARWTTWSDAADVIAVNVDESLVIQKAADTQAGYAGAYSTTRFDLTDGAMSVEVPEVMDAVVGWYLATEVENVHYLFTHDGGQFYVSRVGPSQQDATPWMTYDPATHRFWRIAHTSAASQVTFSTSTDGTTWSLLHTVADLAPVTSLQIELWAGTWYGGSFGSNTARFDNLRVCTTR